DEGDINNLGRGILSAPCLLRHSNDNVDENRVTTKKRQRKGACMNWKKQETDYLFRPLSKLKKIPSLWKI
ncbi:Hypothetical protein FKW44_015065, partial [Caligus rogercresseyi]